MNEGYRNKSKWYWLLTVCYSRRTWCAIPFPVSDPYDPKLPWPDPGWNWSLPQLKPHFNLSSTTPLPSVSSPPSIDASREQLHLQEITAQAGTFASSSLETSLTAVKERLAKEPSRPSPNVPNDALPVDINFWFFLLIYYGAYLAVALIWVTCLFNLYRRESNSLLLSFGIIFSQTDWHICNCIFSELVA